MSFLLISLQRIRLIQRDLRRRMSPPAINAVTRPLILALVGRVTRLARLASAAAMEVNIHPSDAAIRAVHRVAYACYAAVLLTRSLAARLAVPFTSGSDALPFVAVVRFTVEVGPTGGTEFIRHAFEVRSSTKRAAASDSHAGPVVARAVVPAARPAILPESNTRNNDETEGGN